MEKKRYRKERHGRKESGLIGEELRGKQRFNKVELLVLLFYPFSLEGKFKNDK